MNISSDKKKELQAEYKQMKPDMGIFAVINKDCHKYFLVETKNIKGKINSTSFQLRSGSHPNRELLNDWQRLGADHFQIEVLETIDYEEGKDDYRDDLELLRMIWTEKLAAQGSGFY
ncbi:MAG: GIY-YIG nuclease family protein [Syntrophomonadaceae bacterium]